MINICNTLNVQCHDCPFDYQCNMSFNVFGTKEYWLSELKDMLGRIEDAISKVEKINVLC